MTKCFHTVFLCYLVFDTNFWYVQFFTLFPPMIKTFLEALTQDRFNIHCQYHALLIGSMTGISDLMQFNFNHFDASIKIHTLVKVCNEKFCFQVLKWLNQIEEQMAPENRLETALYSVHFDLIVYLSNVLLAPKVLLEDL